MLRVCETILSDAAPVHNQIWTQFLNRNLPLCPRQWEIFPAAQWRTITFWGGGRGRRQWICLFLFNQFWTFIQWATCNLILLQQKTWIWGKYLQACDVTHQCLFFSGFTYLFSHNILPQGNNCYLKGNSQLSAFCCSSDKKQRQCQIPFEHFYSFDFCWYYSTHWGPILSLSRTHWSTPQVCLQTKYQFLQFSHPWTLPRQGTCIYKLQAYILWLQDVILKFPTESELGKT